MHTLIKSAKTVWDGNLISGKGQISSLSKALNNTSFSYSSRFQKLNGTNPEELIASAHAACYSMALAENLENAGFHPLQIVTEDEVYSEKNEQNYQISRLEIFTEAIVPGISFKDFLEIAEKTKETCAISKALNPEIILHATLKLSIINN